LGTSAHRALILHPSLKSVAFAAAQDERGRWVSVFDWLSGLEGGGPVRRGPAPAVLYPANKQAKVPLAFPGNEVPDPVPLDRDHAHAAYDPDSVNRWWRILAGTTKVLQRYRSTFVGKSSPVLFYWGSFDLNATRFSGRPATPPQGPRFFQLAEDQENVSCGFWPGNPNAAGVTLGEPAFYAYTYPAPEGFADAAVRPASAYYDRKLGEFILPYDRVRAQSPDPASADQAILDFFQSTYEAGAALGRWDRAFLERAPARLDREPLEQAPSPPGRGGGPGAAAG